MGTYPTGQNTSNCNMHTKHLGILKFRFWFSRWEGGPEIFICVMRPRDRHSVRTTFLSTEVIICTAGLDGRGPKSSSKDRLPGGATEEKWTLCTVSPWLPGWFLRVLIRVTSTKIAQNQEAQSSILTKGRAIKLSYPFLFSSHAHSGLCLYKIFCVAQFFCWDRGALHSTLRCLRIRMLKAGTW